MFFFFSLSAGKFSEKKKKILFLTVLFPLKYNLVFCLFYPPFPPSIHSATYTVVPHDAHSDHPSFSTGTASPKLVFLTSWAGSTPPLGFLPLEAAFSRSQGQAGTRWVTVKATALRSVISAEGPAKLLPGSLSPCCPLAQSPRGRSRDRGNHRHFRGEFLLGSLPFYGLDVGSSRNVPAVPVA